MGVLIGHASISENGTVNGVAGDQNGREVTSRQFYSKPWSYLLRCKDPLIASKIVLQCLAGIQNPNIGYSQAERNTAYIEAKKVGYDLSKITTPCNTDCSAFATLVAVCAGVKQLEYTGNAPTTSTMVNAFMKTGLFDVCAQPELINTEQYLVLGDILVAPGKHTVIVLEDGPVMKAQRKGTTVSTTTPKTTTTSPTIQVTHSTNTSTTTNSSMSKGIDVSAYNPITNYQQVKDNGVQFVIVKIIRKDGNEDKLFATHVKGFTTVGISINGVYNYSYATTTDQAKLDALKVVQVMQKYKLNCTVWLDVEDNCQKNLGARLIEIINTYHAIIQHYGYKFGVYTGQSFFNSFIKPYKQYLVCQNLWIARYPSSTEMDFRAMPNMDKKPEIGTIIDGWQYSSKCRVDGIKDVVDVSLMFNSTTSNKTKVGIVSNCNKLNFRNAPSLEGQRISVLLAGEKVSILESLDGWYKVQYNGKTGYCSNKYISIV